MTLTFFSKVNQKGIIFLAVEDSIENSKLRITLNPYEKYKKARFKIEKPVKTEDKNYENEVYDFMCRSLLHNISFNNKLKIKLLTSSNMMDELKNELLEVRDELLYREYTYKVVEFTKDRFLIELSIKISQKGYAEKVKIYYKITEKEMELQKMERNHSIFKLYKAGYSIPYITDDDILSAIAQNKKLNHQTEKLVQSARKALMLFNKKIDPKFIVEQEFKNDDHYFFLLNISETLLQLDLKFRKQMLYSMELRTSDYVLITEDCQKILPELYEVAERFIKKHPKYRLRLMF